MATPQYFPSGVSKSSEFLGSAAGVVVSISIGCTVSVLWCALLLRCFLPILDEMSRGGVRCKESPRSWYLLLGLVVQARFPGTLSWLTSSLHDKALSSSCLTPLLLLQFATILPRL